MSTYYVEKEIAKINCHIAKFTSQGVNRAEQANTYYQMEVFARVAEKEIFGALERLVEKIGSIDCKPSDVTVNNEKVGESITLSVGDDVEQSDRLY